MAKHTHTQAILKTCLLKAIKGYRFALSCLLGNVCRFEPTCSAYALEAIEYHGCRQGLMLTLRRILRCHPFHPGGIDHVPKP